MNCIWNKEKMPSRGNSKPLSLFIRREIKQIVVITQAYKRQQPSVKVNSTCKQSY
jgi:hypothetical protein